MSKRVAKDKETTPPDGGVASIEDGSPPGTAVDFIFKTMSQRAGVPGKRQIRPKNVEELMTADIQELGSDEDPDFDVSKDKYHNESDLSIDESDDGEGGSGKIDDDENDKGSMDGNVEDSDDEDDDSYDANQDINNYSSGDSDVDESNSDSDEKSGDERSPSPVKKKSALRDTLEKLSEAAFHPPPSKKKRKKPKKTVNASTSIGGKAKGKSDDASKSKKKVSKTSKKESNTQPSKKKQPLGSSKASDQSHSKLKRPKRKASEKSKSISNRVLDMEKSQKENRKEISVGSPICSACLGKASDELNEIVECDSCGITVHEGDASACYGISDTLSVSSGSGSSCSTEPWFCDACKTGAKFISCELCPIKGGLYKETSVGRWVHLVCSRYTPGVGFNETGLPSLLDIPYTRWGAHPCSICEDLRFARSGICIPCDAGLCKSYLHATCAQKSGLLSDPVTQTMEADPFFAACKLHTNRETSKRRSKQFSILQEQLRIKREQKLCDNLTPAERHSQNRIRRKLERIRFKVAIKQAHSFSQVQIQPAESGPLSQQASQLNMLPPHLSPFTPDILPQSWKEGQKRSRLLPTSAGTAISFLRKAELMGLDIKALDLEDKNTRIVASVKKKWNVLPGLGVEFAAYYADRENRISTLTQQCAKLEKETRALNRQQEDVQESFDQHYVHAELMTEDTDRMRDEFIELSELLKGIIPSTQKKLITEINGIVSKVEVPDRRRSPSQGKRVSPHKSGTLKKTQVVPSIPSSTERLSIKVCSVCNKSDEQPWIIRCDHCHKFYHLKCLDPPLNRIPKRSRLCGWMCSDCGEEELDASDPEVDPEAPRTLRGRTNIRKPGKYRHSTDSRDENMKALSLAVAEINNLEIKHEISTSTPTSLENSKLEIKTPASEGDTSNLLNGGKKAAIKRRSDSIVVNTPNPLSIFDTNNIPITDISISESPSSQENRKITPKKLNNGTGTPLAINRKPKQYRKKKDSVLNTSNADPNISQMKTSKESGGMVNKVPRKRPAKVKTTISSVDDPSQNGSSATTVPNKKRRKSSIGSLKTLSADGKTKVKRQRKKPLLETSGDPMDASSEVKPAIFPETTTKKRKRQKTLSSAKQAAIDKEKESIILGNMMAAAAEVKKNEEVALIINGNPKIKPLAKKRKSLSKSSLTSGSSSVGGGKEKPLSVYGKKKKKIQPTSPQQLTNQSAIIDAVAVGSFPIENGMRAVSGGSLTQGMVHKLEWNSKNQTQEEENDHSIMKGHAMSSNCNSEEIVTVKTSDLIDYVINTSCSTGSTQQNTPVYTPGFYSTTSTSTVMETNSTFPSSVIDNPLRNLDTDGIWGQSAEHPPAQDGQNQNVIKLHYEAPESSAVIPSQPSYPPIQNSTQPSTNEVETPALSPIKPGDNRCFSCRQADVKKNMVTCDKCAQDFHFMCLRPPLKYSPRRRGYSWYCHFCDTVAQEALAKHKEKELSQAQSNSAMNNAPEGISVSATSTPTTAPPPASSATSSLSASPAPAASSSMRMTQQQHCNLMMRLQDERLKNLINALNQ